MKLALKALIGSFLGLSSWTVWGSPQARVSLSQAQFVSPDYRQTFQKNYQFLSAGIDTLKFYQSEVEIEDSLQAEIRGMVAPGSSVLNYLNISQLYRKQDILTVGRKKVAWSRLDEEYSFGVYQPLFKWNSLQWESQGLTGFFLHFESASGLPWGLTLFGSPVFIPNQGASFEVKEGTFQASNPFFKAPPTVAIVQDRSFDINYDIRKPEVQDVVLRQSFAGRAFLGSPERGGYWQLAYAFKPMNELNMGFVGYAPPSSKKVNVEILPVVSNHHALSSDLQWSSENFRLGVSVLYDSPQEPQFDSEWTYASFTNSTLVSPSLGFRNRNAELSFSVLSVTGGESLGRGPESSQANQFIPQRYPFRNAGQLSAKYQLRWKRHEALAFSTRYLRGEAGEFDLWLSQVAYQWTQGWAMSLVTQMVAVEDNLKGERTAFSPYVNNDLVAMGVSYVF
jgi:hypothetical protein